MDVIHVYTCCNLNYPMLVKEAPRGRGSGGLLNIKMSSYQYRNPHVKDKTVSAYLGKAVFILRRDPDVLGNMTANTPVQYENVSATPTKKSWIQMLIADTPIFKQLFRLWFPIYYGNMEISSQHFLLLNYCYLYQLQPTMPRQFHQYSLV